MDALWYWWILAIAVIAIELTTGTVYLLMVSLGLFAGGAAAWLGQSFSVQLLIAAVLAAAGCGLVQRQRAKTPAPIEQQRNADVQIDLGNQVVVQAWQTDATAQVQYRGAQWAAKLDVGPSAGAAGLHSIVAMQGNTLVLKPIAK